MKAKVALLVPFIVALFLVQGWMQSVRIFPFWSKHYSPRQDTDLSSLSPDQLLAAMAGFREMIAGLLWVKADTYFNEGNYDAILPMVRIVTMLDSKQVEVYTTGMWHIAYNFTDEAQRSDRRYIVPAIALGKEGSRLNDYSYEITFDVGWLWFHKIDDNYSEAVKYFEEASAFDREKLTAKYMGLGLSEVAATNRAGLNGIPDAKRDLLAHAMIRDNRITEAIDQFDAFYVNTSKKSESAPDANEKYELLRTRDTIEQNLDAHLVRMASRGDFARMRGETSLAGYDTDPAFDVGFSASVTVIEPKVLLVEGTWNVLSVGCRLRFILRDADFKGAVPAGMVWDRGEKVEFTTPGDETFLQDQLFVKNQRFSRKIDLSRDVTMYPLEKENYVMEFYYNPRSAPAHIQDKFGFGGEGMTDANYLNTDIRDGQRVVYATLEIPQDMIYLRGDYRRGVKQAVVTTPNYNANKRSSSANLIQVPGLRTED